jgi:putative FmdB family regulatory protein
MPLFDYKCPACSHKIERLQRHGDPAPACDKCAKPMERQISRTSFALKGYGWASEGYHSRPPWDLAPGGER